MHTHSLGAWENICLMEVCGSVYPSCHPPRSRLVNRSLVALDSLPGRQAATTEVLRNSWSSSDSVFFVCVCMQVAQPSLHSPLSFSTLLRKCALNTDRLCIGEMHFFAREHTFRQMHVDTVFSLIHLQFVSVCETHFFEGYMWVSVISVMVFTYMLVWKALLCYLSPHFHLFCLFEGFGDIKSFYISLIKRWILSCTELILSILLIFNGCEW